MDRPPLAIDSISAPAWRVMFGLAVGILLVSGGLATWLYQRFADATARVEHTYLVLNEIDDLAARVVAAEAGQRGYIITRDPRFFRRYEDVRDQAAGLATVLQTLVSDDSSQSVLAARLRRAVDTRLDELSRVRFAFEAGRTDEMRVGFDRGRTLMEDIGAIAADMRAAETSRLVQRGSQVRFARRAAVAFAGLTLGLAVVLAGVGASLDRSFRRRQQALDRETTARAAAERSAATAIADLDTSERLAQSLLDTSADCVALVDLDGRIVSMNAPGLALMGLTSADDVRGRPWPDLWGSSTAVASRALEEAVVAGEGRFQGSRPRPDGTVEWWDVVITPIRKHAGTVVRLLSVSRDVTRQKGYEAALRDSEQRFRTLADAMPQIVWSARADGYHDYFNARWYGYTGSPQRGEPSGERDAAGLGHGWSWRDYVHPSDVDAALAAWVRSLASGQSYHAQWRLRRQDGTYRWFIARALPLRDADGAVARWFGTCTDIDDEKRVEDQRALLLTEERAARAEAERSARIKDEFVSTLSHELRTPLNAIVGWVGVLKQEPSEANVSKGLAVIDRNLQRQTQMIDDLLDMSRIEAGKLRLNVQAVDLASIVDEAVTSARPAADAKGVQLATSLCPAPAIRADAGRLQQIVWNLVTNAVKFTPRGGQVRVTLRRTGGQMEMQVSDTGAGIPSHFLPQVFQRFRQADSSPTRQHGGLGLGLAIVKNLVEMHGGSVEARSEGAGHGSLFTVHLPITVPTAPDMPEAPGTPGARAALRRPVLSGLRVLIVEDEADARELMHWFLADAGADPIVASSVNEALAALHDGLVPDVIVSDIGMPDRDGYDFMARVRRLPGPAAAVPAAALTAMARGEDRERAFAAGFQSHLPKPVDRDDLVGLVARLAGRTG
ncbi:MAG: PAS domain-containing protein [Acidobacteria bacterium]|nr:PAS domain-containing protein [Acidobacteriota bacterium]